MKSWKIGAISGLIAGITAGIVASIFHVLMINIGFMTRASNVVETQIIINIIWGAIFGAIYSKVNRLIPGRPITKGLYFGLFVLLIANLRDVSFALPYAIFFLWSVGLAIVGFFQYVAFGSIIGILYDSLFSKYGTPKVEPKIKTYPIMSGINVGAIAGLIGGVMAFLSRVVGNNIGLFKFLWNIPVTPIILTYVAALHILINMVWGAVFGAIYTKVYSLVPGKGIIKGLYYGLIFFLVASFRTTLYQFGWGDVEMAWMWFFVGVIQAIVFGLVLGLLYRKPSE
jgi:hypothetical protein